MVPSEPDDPLWVDPEIARARTLPPWAFTDPAHHQQELKTVFSSSWLFVPQRSGQALRDDPRSLTDQVRRRGAQLPVSVIDTPLVLQRDWDGDLHAFPNVCTHAWHTLVQGPGRERAIVCPQHGRRFDTKGRYVSQEGFEGVEEMPGPDDHLRSLGVHEQEPFLFVCLGERASPADRLMAPMLESLGKLRLDALERRPMDHEVRTVAGNWKQHAWNYLDTLHIPYIHARPGGLSEAVHLDSYQTERHGDSVLQWAYAKDPAHGFDPELLPERFAHPQKRVFALWWFLFPNLTLNFYPWGLSVNVYHPSRSDPLQTRFHWYHYLWDPQKYEQRESVWMLESVDDEDIDALTQVARGVRSGLASRGRFAPEKETGPHWFHRRVYEAVKGGRDGPRD